MERLRQRDLETSLDYLRGLYARRDPEDFKRHVLETITGLVPSELTTYNELDLRTSDNVWEWEPAPSAIAGLSEAFTVYMDENPCVAYFRRTGDRRATKISDFLTQRELRALGYYDEYLRRVGLEHRMSVVIPKPPHSVIALALGRGGRDFSERDRLLLDLQKTPAEVTHSPDGAGKTVWMVGTDLVTFKATGEETGGAYALFDSLMIPGRHPTSIPGRARASTC